MGKIAIIGFHNLHLMQFLYKYTNLLDEKGIDYDVLYWNRDGVEYLKKFHGGKIEFNYPTSNYVSKWKKIQGYLNCRRFFIKMIKQNGYEKIILLTSQTAVALSTIALIQFRKSYIYDYRDLTMENIKVYDLLIRKLVNESYFTAISSKGFIPFIGKRNEVDYKKFVVSHNCNNDMICREHVINKELPVKLVFWGMVRQVEYQKKICDYFGNDNRFELCYHGEGASEELKKYCAQKGYCNIVFTGRYLPEEIGTFVADTDVLMNLYGNNGKQEHALTVKLYDGVRYGLPMLVTKNSYMDYYLGNKKFKYSFSFDQCDKDNILKWYGNLDRENLEESINDFSKTVARDEAIFKKSLIDFCED